MKLMGIWTYLGASIAIEGARIGVPIVAGGGLMFGFGIAFLKEGLTRAWECQCSG